jgi:ferritin-like protein
VPDLRRKAPLLRHYRSTGGSGSAWYKNLSQNSQGREIVGKDVDKLIEMLNKALADEWLAYYQYWVGAKVAKGPMRGTVATELLEHATEELGHAELLSDSIVEDIQLMKERG